MSAFDYFKYTFFYKIKQIRILYYLDYDEKDKILIGMRTGSHGANTIALPGGHLEMFETFEDCAMREIKEECNLDSQPHKETNKFQFCQPKFKMMTRTKTLYKSSK